MDVPDWVLKLPAVNAGLNSLATVLLITGYRLIKAGKRDAHKNVMLAAFLTSIAFLGCYLVYHFQLEAYTGSGSKPFPGTGTMRIVYLAILVTHILLAFFVPFLALGTIVNAWLARWEKHRRLAKITFPIWVYVSITGVIIYFMVYHWPSS
ncbi:MAG: hypothetical protein CMJ78_20090 [Planctomycetaceae bacterium]|nr:hypothetical protein [Planctomycetaceae bacterium]